MPSASAAVPAHVPNNLVYDFDLFAPEGGDEDVHLAWKRLQGTAPDIFWTPRNGGHWVVTRGEDIKQVQTNYELFSNAVTTIPPSHEWRFIPVNLDPPEHGAYRNLILPAFMPTSVRALEGFARDVAISQIEGFAAKGECEFMEEFARVLPVVVFLRMVDLPASDRTLLSPLAEIVVRSPDRAAKLAAINKLAQYLEEKIQDRRQCPGRDLISTILQAKIDDKPITPANAFNLSLLLLLGGLDTVASMMGFIARFLALHPTHRHRLATDPAILPRAINELLRRHGVSNTARLITKDCTYKGIEFRKGELIQQPNSLYGLDERIVSNPLIVDFDRQPPADHVVFGSGIHVCPGAGLARREIQIFIEEWLRRIPDFEIKSGTRPKMSSGIVNGVETLHLTWPKKANY